MKSKPSRCPQCEGETVVPILYGMPTEEAFLEEEQGLIALGGCCQEIGAPIWHCNACEHEWGGEK